MKLMEAMRPRLGYEKSVSAGKTQTGGDSKEIREFFKLFPKSESNPAGRDS